MNVDTTKIGEKQIDSDVIEAIKSGLWNHETFGFSMPQLDRAMYQKVAKVLEALGGKWNRRSRSTLFEDQDAMQSVIDACETGVYVDLKKAYQFFETPPEVAEKLVTAARISDGTSILEPGCGKGAIIRAIANEVDELGFSEGVDVLGIDINPEYSLGILNEFIDEPFCDVRFLNGDFLSFYENRIGSFQTIIMNPPFSRFQDINHVMRAYDFLTEGGRLVAVMSDGFTFRQDTRSAGFRDWLEVNGWHWEPLPEGSFKSSGTNVNTVMVIIDK
ncbi:Methyltransferase small domain protein [Gimesia alba]|uniref:Methyltransferase small domain protein n=1 Tax=Gimesia alba TaxID=2527973 RepID=A0A517RAY3_9PLAN|nr:class I SAM-dependent methyltransferase [Gimesia alba]QDT41046.1 Methyltransferase small domain protein [Gimesia alba]